MIFVDTNYFLRYLRNDIPEQSKIADKLFLDAANGKKNIFTSLVVFFEVYWVVSRSYVYSKDKILEVLRGILAMGFMVLDEKELLKKALDIYEKTSLELEDCYNIVYSEESGAKQFATFDKKLGNYMNKK